ncbi:MAG: hypothetical protein MJ201_01445 [Mycoplasmoidaceae bacterium]|nr:hypothetical protein [Mycoplasmoidaceae bacterium]
MRIFDGEVIKLQFVLPVDENGKKRDSLIIAKDEEIGKLENDKSLV